MTCIQHRFPSESSDLGVIIILKHKSVVYLAVFLSPYSAGVVGGLVGLPGWGRQAAQGSSSQTVHG